MDISDFNRKLSVFIADARVLEKTDRTRANAMWLKICEFAVEFSKQKNVDRTLRLRIWRQVDQILKKVKNEEIPSSVPTPQPAASDQKVPFEVDFGLDFPSVPKSDETSDSKEESSAPFQAPSPPEESSTESNEDEKLFQDAISSEPKPKVEVEDFVERIRKMEEELRSMPDIFKEIKPPEYSPDKSIIPSSAPPPHVSPEQPTEPVTAIERDNSLNIEPVEKPDTIDPYKGTKDSVEIKDPFGPEGQPAQDAKEKVSQKSDLHCYACGNPIREKDTICSKCGAEL